MNRIDAFATPVWVDDLAELAPHRERWVQAIRDLRQHSRDTGARVSNRGGWRSENTLLDLPDFALLQQRLTLAIKAALSDYGIQPGSLVLNLQGWANVHDAGGYNVEHVHEGCLLSGTVYMSAPPGAGSIYLKDPRPAALMEDLPRTAESLRDPAHNRKMFSIEPRELRLVMFPSWLSHGVEPCECEERVSVAFNVMRALMPAA